MLEELSLENGIPQWSVIAPALFTIFINDLSAYMLENVISNKTKSPLNLGLFADDTAFWRAGRMVSTLKRFIQNDIDNLQSWADRWGVKISF